MNSTDTINYFNFVTESIFECLSEIKYSVRLIEINEINGFIGLSIDTDYYASQITVLLPDNKHYQEDMSCSVQMYDINDEELLYAISTVTLQSIEDCMYHIIGNDVVENLTAPKVYLN